MRSPYVHIFGKSDQSSSNSSQPRFTKYPASLDTVSTIPVTAVREIVFHGDILKTRASTPMCRAAHRSMMACLIAIT